MSIKILRFSILLLPTTLKPCTGNPIAIYIYIYIYIHQSIMQTNRYSLVHDLVWDVKRDDFFPYVLNPGAYWSGN